ncbi:Fibronectin type 3 domain-containing protein [Flavobacterium sp. 9AF]|uniref:fibronectin type III domain-containing protein n=1 Tax=Flavobacterium sp. 9AF TaxID=2653142 RepID=UPI0012EF603C|nr:hypothetical protein [Flavobacterium sp. 9AF]VXB22520.1 Fibronectin type 3 domain-containing protein [Flavobacterium sp. 9AF]
MRKLYIYVVVFVCSFSVRAQEYQLFAASGNNKVELKWMSKKIVKETAFDIFRQEKGNWKKLNLSPIVPSVIIAENELDTSKNNFPNDEAYKIYIKHYSKNEKDPNKQAFANYNLAVNSIFSNDLAKHRGIYFEDSTVQNNKVYSYKLVDANSQKELSIITNLKVGELGIAPEKLSAKQVNQNVGLSWEANENYIGYNLYRNNVKVNNEPILPNAEQGKIIHVKYVDNDVLAGNYSYIVKGITFLNTESNPSSKVDININDKTPPKKIEGFKGSRNGNEIILTWKLSTEEDVAGYYIHKSIDNGKSFEKITSQPLTSSESKYIEKVATDLVNTYQFKIEAIDKNGNGNMSNPVSVFVPDTQAPLQPVDLVAQSEVGKITLSWRPNPEKDLAGYRIYRGLIDDDENNMTLLNVEPQVKTLFVDTFNEKAGTKFIYKVVAVDRSFNQSEKAVIWVQLPDVIPPVAPFLSDIKTEKNQVILNWNPVLDDAIQGYEVYRIIEEKEEKISRDLISQNSFIDEINYNGIIAYYVKAVDSSQLRSNASNKIAIVTGDLERDLSVQLNQEIRSKKVLIKLLGIKLDEVSEVMLFKKIGQGGFSIIPSHFVENEFLDLNTEENTIYEYFVEVILNDNSRIRSEKRSINNVY